MPLYDFLAPAYDPVFESIFLPFRTRALEFLPTMKGATILDLACGTGQNFPLLAERIGAPGKIIGVDISEGMLSRAHNRVKRNALPNVSLIQMDAADLTPSALAAQTGFSAVDFILCTYSLTSMRNWREAFQASWNLIKPRGGFVIHDIDAEKRTLHSCLVEIATRSDFSQNVWRPLQTAGIDFRMDYLDPSAHLFGGRLFVAYATKPPLTSQFSPCLS